MATNPETLAENVGRITASDANYTYGSAKDDTTGLAGDGTPIKKAYMNDIYGFFQWLLTQASIVPSGNSETILASDLGDALDALYGRLDDFDNDLVAEGFQKFPGGLVLQWGVVTATSSPDVLVLPIAFPTAGLAAAVTDEGLIGENVGYLDLTTSTITIRTDTDTVPGSVAYIAIGH